MKISTQKITPVLTGKIAREGPAIRRVTLCKFRNYETLRLELTRKPVVLTGLNGAGKTNLLEALSFLAPGRGLRRARLSELTKSIKFNGRNPKNLCADNMASEWAIAAEIEDRYGTTKIGTGLDPKGTLNGSEKRIVRIDDRSFKSQTSLTEYIALTWLTPQMDRLFLEGAKQRRQFLDRLVYTFDSGHAHRITRYLHAVRERSRLLKEGYTDERWHAALEEQIITLGVAVAAGRQDLLRRMAPLAAVGTGPFPGAILSVEGQIETWLMHEPALDVENRWRRCLANERTEFSAISEKTPGPHLSDFSVWHVGKKVPAKMASTGEQKALLIAIILAHSQLLKFEYGSAPLMLLDEVSAHLDKCRRDALYDSLEMLGSQFWLTGTDISLFDNLKSRAQFFEISDGVVIRK